jgi:uncharacterized protein (TIGR00730 family)
MSQDTPIDDSKLKLLIDEFVTSAISQRTITKLDKKLIVELITTSLKLANDKPNTLNLKIATAALTEMREAFVMFAPYTNRKKVTIFGSARTTKDDPLYKLTQEVAKSLSENGWMVVTGAGPGIMEAGMSGAGREMSIGVSIRLPFETSANPIIAGDEKYVAMRYFFTRKLMLVKESDAFICMPGGFGTLDEMFELLTLLQTGKGNPAPIVLLDLPGDPFWEDVDSFVKNSLLPRKLVSESDLALYHVASGVHDAVDTIQNFYRNYHSTRIVGSLTVIRLREEVLDARLAELNQQFAYLSKAGTITKITPTAAELADNDNLDLHRIAFEFTKRDFGGLRKLIDQLNRQ